ncbi:MAG: vWA domain-containing protein [Inquilinaceae bacterium]
MAGQGAVATATTRRRATLITGRVAGFIDHLRLNGFAVGPGETQAALTVLARPPVPRDAARRHLKVLLASRHEEWTRFDDLFAAYWFPQGRERRQWRPAAASHGRSIPDLPRAWRDHLGSEGDVNSPQAPQRETLGETETGGAASGRLVASLASSRARTDFRKFVDPQEMAEAERLAYRLAVVLRYRLSRRYRATTRGRRLDLRRTIRANLCHGGEPIDLHHKSIPDRPVRVVVFLDVSGSMKHYSRIFLQFVKGLVCEWVDADAYLFHTKLVRVTDAVREKSAMKAMTRLSLMADGFGGGTRLGDSLKVFNDSYAKKALNSRTVVLILSDGYDTGPSERMVAELKRLKKRAPRLVWLNPLLGWENYRPVNAAMTAAMPYIDHFAAANTLEALAALEPELARL